MNQGQKGGSDWIKDAAIYTKRQARKLVHDAFKAGLIKAA